MEHPQVEVKKVAQSRPDEKLMGRRTRRIALLACALVLAFAAMQVALPREEGFAAALINSTWGKWQEKRMEASREELMRGCVKQGFATFDACFDSSLSTMGPG
ncbi:hypothetical protein AWB76_06791 [Caballeronia temeraria]|uniref:Uncharacterized protein n=2 Tax=Caballeronia TaxID=1827195 RepID=A0A158CVL7_9BURK|nr:MULTISPECIES: hypothetical protein [Caballeronia]SAK86281.1 hypothetical protein AWB77_04587 [Caballeronia fortuita]SAK92246.1 hypothetical protein AWB76_06791 [Caballeronia temeraria]